MGLLSQAHRLVTREDGRFLHAHKVLGVLALAHFGWRLWLWTSSHSMGFDGASGWTLAAAGLHVALVASSFEFHIPRRRNRVYNVIWPEMRWHTAIFSLRSALAMVLIWLADTGRVAAAARACEVAWSQAGTWMHSGIHSVIAATVATALPGYVPGSLSAALSHVLPAADPEALLLALGRYAIVVATMAAADAATRAYQGDVGDREGDEGREGRGVSSRTMRGNPYPPGYPEAARVATNLFYSFSQVGATLGILTSRNVGTAFLMLLPIQLAPLLMTLVKKGIMRQGGWHLWYALALLLNYVYSAYSETSACASVSATAASFSATAVVPLAFSILRFGFGVDKYLLWTATFFLSPPFFG
jgi:hypothetical protein